MKDGACHLSSLRDGREVYILGRRVEDVTTDPAFRNSVASAAGLYDFQSAPENIARMTFPSPQTSERVNRSWQLPSNTVAAPFQPLVDFNMLARRAMKKVVTHLLPHLQPWSGLSRRL